jgi:hypothetical protein
VEGGWGEEGELVKERAPTTTQAFCAVGLPSASTLGSKDGYPQKNKSFFLRTCPGAMTNSNSQRMYSGLFKGH